MTDTAKKPSTPKALTAEEAKAALYQKGVTLKQWAEANNYPIAEVYKIMSGERKGLYGRGHEIAVKLGLKVPFNPDSK